MRLSLRFAPSAELVQDGLPGPFGNLGIMCGQGGLGEGDPQVRPFGGLVACIAYAQSLAAVAGTQAFFLPGLSVFNVIDTASSEQPVSILHVQL